MKLWCQHLFPHRAFKRHWIHCVRQVGLCLIERKTWRCVCLWRDHFLKFSKDARLFLLDPVCLALPFLIVIWMSFLIQVIIIGFDIWSSHSSVAEDRDLVRCDAVSGWVVPRFEDSMILQSIVNLLRSDTVSSQKTWLFSNNSLAECTTYQ